VLTGQARFLPGQKLSICRGAGGVVQSAVCLRRVIPAQSGAPSDINGFSGKRCFVTKRNVNKMNNISNRSSVLPILRKHEQFSAILESRTIQTAGTGWKACR